MRKFVKPTIIISKCLGFAHCRYNGQVIPDEFVEKLKPYVEFRPICPEVEIGLGVPRDPIRVILAGNEFRLVQPATGLDVTDKMRDFAESFLNSAGEVDGFILKARSPSCGPKDVRVYTGIDKEISVSKDSGFFAKAVLEKFPNLAIEDEGRIKNFTIREHFLTKLFTLSSFRKVRESNLLKELVQFHSENKLLLMAYNQNEMRLLGKIVANTEKKPIDELIEDYGKGLYRAIFNPPKFTSNINVLMHGMGYFSQQLSPREKEFFLDSLERYRAEVIPLSVPLNILRGFIIRFEQEYLIRQTFFEPYPESLMDITDSGKGRNL